MFVKARVCVNMMVEVDDKFQPLANACGFEEENQNKLHQIRKFNLDNSVKV